MQHRTANLPVVSVKQVLQTPAIGIHVLLFSGCLMLKTKEAVDDAACLIVLLAYRRGSLANTLKDSV